MTNVVEKSVEIKAPVSRVWRALTNYVEFGKWFGVILQEPFTEGKRATGRITNPGYEHIEWNVEVVKIEPETYFSFTWIPYAVDPTVDYSSETPTTVEFHLHEIHGGSLLTVTETGFDDVPEWRRADALRMNDKGWSIQMTNINDYVANH